jgi:hypothetical protein
VGELAVAQLAISYIGFAFFGALALPALIFGGWLIKLWLTIHLFKCVFLDYPYLPIGIAFLVIGLLEIICARYGVKRQRYWRLLLILPVVTGLCTLVTIPNLVPLDQWTLSHAFNVKRELYLLGEQERRFPDDGKVLQDSAERLSSPYYRDGQQLPYRVVTFTNATGPFLSDPGPDPGVIFYAVSADHRQAWLTATDLRFPNSVGGHVRFAEPLSDGENPRVIAVSVSKEPLLPRP